jgi:hypothetical protein
MTQSQPEMVDVLSPSTLEKIGLCTTIPEAHRKGDWLGSFNLFVLQRYPWPAILYQQRSFSAQLWPGLLDVSAGGYYQAGEEPKDGLREVREELGKDYSFRDLIFLGKKLYMRDEPPDRYLRYAVDVFFVEDNSPLSSFALQREELEGLFVCPIDNLLAVHSGAAQGFIAEGMRFEDDGELRRAEIEVRKDMFPHNWDQYHYKIAILSSRYFREDPFLVY